MLLRQAGSCPGEITQIANHQWGYEAAPQQSVLQKLRDPLTVLRVRLAPGNCLDVLGVCQNDLEVTFENVPYRLPINACGFHRHVLDVKLLQPRDQLSKLAGGATEAANVLQWFP